MNSFTAELKAKLMLRTLALAKKGAKLAPPNPMVGAVLATPDGKIISESWHKKYKSHHAEYAALKNVGEVPKKAALFVNLEPCAHHAHTPPCCDIIIAKKVKHVVYGCLDPNPLVNGLGIKRLVQAGVKVELSSLKETCLNFNRVFIHHTKHKSAYLAIKFGASLDGKIALKNGQSKWITNIQSRKKVQELRSFYQAVAMGKNTLVQDNPRMTTRLNTKPVQKSNAVVFSSNGKLPQNLNFFNDHNLSRKILVSGSKISAGDEKTLAKFNVEVIKTSTQIPTIEEALLRLYQAGIFSILLEGGSKTFTSAIKERKINYLHSFKAPLIIGGDGLPLLGDLGLTKLTSGLRFELFLHQDLGSDIYSEYQVCY